MPTVGYAAAMEQFHPTELLEFCKLAERYGMSNVMVADHFQPWVPKQGQSGFAWSWMGALGVATGQRFGSGVTAPGFRYHPAILAQAGATLEAMFPGRFWLGIGSGEALNEHIAGDYWPEQGSRFGRLKEAVELIKKLYSGKKVRHDGKYFRMETTQIWTLPSPPPPIYVAASGPQTAEFAGRETEGLITPAAAPEKLKGLLDQFAKGARSAGKDPATMPKLLQVHISWAETQEEAERNALTEWPNGGMNFPKADIRSPEDFEAMAKLVRLENFKGRVLISPDLEAHRAHIQSYFDLGFDEVHVHNVGRNQEQFLKAFGEQVMPTFSAERKA
jgi:coenzyme F420-dependent glucose-6-phosphate dehydrogenase